MVQWRAVLMACDMCRPTADCCCWYVRSVRAVLCEVVQLGLALPDELVTTLEQGHSADSALPRRALSDVLAGCRSTVECDLRDVLSVSTVLDQPVWNQPLPDAGGADLHPDACLARARLVVEVDSIEWHRLGDRVEATERRRARYAALGWTVLPVSPGGPGSSSVIGEASRMAISCAYRTTPPWITHSAAKPT